MRAADDLLAAELEAAPEFAREWRQLAPARHVAVELIRYRSDNRLSQRDLAEQLGVSQSRVSDLESGEENARLEMLTQISAITGIEFANSSFDR